MNIYSSVDGNNIDKIIVLFNSVLINADSKKKEQLKFYLLVDKLPNELPFIPDELKSILEIKELELNGSALLEIDACGTRKTLPHSRPSLKKE